MMRKYNLAMMCGLGLLALAGCSGAKEELGLTRRAPDEFAVVKRAPLAMPPGYGLVPPRPGALRPQEETTADMARSSIFGEETEAGAQTNTQPSSAEAALLGKVGAAGIDPAIRTKVDQETAAIAKDSVPVAKKLLGRGTKPEDAPASVVNATKEAERLKQNREAGKPLTVGNTPAIEQ